MNIFIKYLIMSIELVIIFLNNYSEEEKENISQNIQVNNSNYPLYYLDYFISEHILVNLEKYTDNPSEIQYNFIYQIEPGKTASCNIYIINDFSKTHDICLYSDSYIIFCNPEKKDTKSKLSQIINYIKEECLTDIITNIIGVYDNCNSSIIKLDDMKSFLNGHKFMYKYYQIYEEKEFKSFLKEKYNIKNLTEENNYINSNQNENFGNILETLDKIFIHVFHEKRMRGPRKEIPNNKYNEDKSDASNCKSCVII